MCLISIGYSWGDYSIKCNSLDGPAAPFSSWALISLMG